MRILARRTARFAARFAGRFAARFAAPFAAACLCAVGLARAALAQDAASVIASGDRAFAVKVRTLKEVRLQESFRTTVRQQFDFSCGSAALATLLTYHYGRPVTEQQAFEAMFAAGDQTKIRREGFSLLDMKRFLASVGFQSDGFEITLDELAGAKVPAIALIRDNGYNHFVVVKGVEPTRVLVGDPSSGTRILHRTEFESLWQVRILFVMRSHVGDARFNQSAEWAFRRRVPIDETILRESTSTAILMRPGFADF